MFFKFLIYLILGFYILGFLGRLWLRWFLAKKQKEFAQGKGSKGFYYSTSFGSDANKAQSNKTGDVNIEQLKSTERKVNGKVGDYVDFEELK